MNAASSCLGFSDPAREMILRDYLFEIKRVEQLTLSAPSSPASVPVGTESRFA
jgi:hypothetical protein